MNGDGIRLAKLTLPAKLMVTLFVLIVGPGYLCGIANIYFNHQLADDEPGLTIDDLRAAFHGMEKTYKPDDKIIVNSNMLKEVRPGGEHARAFGRRRRAGDSRIDQSGWKTRPRKMNSTSRDWLKRVTRRPKRLSRHIASSATTRMMAKVRTSLTRKRQDSEPQYSLVMAMAKPDIKKEVSGMQTKVIKPISIPRLVQVTHVHVLTMPVFAFLVGVLFMMTGVPNTLKLIIGPLPLLAVMLDIGGWWAARWVEPFIFVIGAAGGLFGTFYAIQILCVLGSLWLGRKTT